MVYPNSPLNDALGDALPVERITVTAYTGMLSNLYELEDALQVAEVDAYMRGMMVRRMLLPKAPKLQKSGEDYDVLYVFSGDRKTDKMIVLGDGYVQIDGTPYAAVSPDSFAALGDMLNMY